MCSGTSSWGSATIAEREEREVGHDAIGHPRLSLWRAVRCRAGRRRRSSAGASVRRMIAAVLAAAALAAPQPQLLVVTETRGFVHDSIPAAKAMVASLGYRTRFLNGARELTAARLRGAGAVVFLNTSGELRLDARGTAPAAGLRARRRRLRRRARGRRHLPRTGRPSTACSAPTSSATRPPRAAPPTRIDVVDHAFTTLRTFAIGDEFYRFRARAKRHVVVREHGGGPLAWWRRYGRGRVFYDALGHFPATWSDAAPAPAHGRRHPLGYRDPSATLTTKPLPALTLTLCASPAGTTKLAAPSTS